MKQNVLIGGITLLAIAVVIGLSFFGEEKGTGRNSSPENEPTAKHTIVLTKNGFEPHSLEIVAGDTVKFTSENGGWYWPASNPHPTHTTYAAFDPGEPIDKNAPWTFTFPEEGEWHYHDHLAPYFTGTIKVRKAP